MPTICKTRGAKFVMSQDNVQDGIAVEPYGAIIYPTPSETTEVNLHLNKDGAGYIASTDLNQLEVGSTITFQLPLQ